MSEKKLDSEARPPTGTGGLVRRLDAAGWGLFFIWVGVSLLMDLGWGVGLVGVAAVIFLKQAARMILGRKLEVFWVAVGALILFGGIWELYHIDVDPVPMLLILVGCAFLLGLFGRRRSTSWSRCRSFRDGAGHSSRRRTDAEGRSLACCGWRR